MKAAQKARRRQTLRMNPPVRNNPNPNAIPNANRTRARGNDIPNNYRGTIAAEAAARAAETGAFGLRPVSEGETLVWVRSVSGDVIKKMVRKQTFRPSGSYAGIFHNKYRKCFNLVIKVAESEVEDATELSEKLVFMLSRLIYFQVRVEGSTVDNQCHIKEKGRHVP